MTQGSDRWWDALERYESRVFSQHGEDGVIDEIFTRIDTSNRYCVEFGVQDGSECNTRRLVEQRNWNGLWMDGCDAYKSSVMHEWISAENVNDVFARHNVPDVFDLLSIDIDGNDYWVWAALEYRPRVVMIEYNASIPPNESRTIKYDPAFRWDGTDYFGASLLALQRLGLRKGYTLIHCESAGANAFFIAGEIIAQDKSRPIQEVFRPPAYGEPGQGHPHDPQSRAWVEVETG